MNNPSADKQRQYSQATKEALDRILKAVEPYKSFSDPVVIEILVKGIADELEAARSSCTARDAALEEAALVCESRQGSQATGAFRVLGSAADAIRALKNAPVPESADTVAVPVKHLHSLVTDEPLQPHLVRAWAQEMLNAAGQVPNVEARPNYGGSAGQSRDEQSSATRLKAETPAHAAPLSASAEHDPWKEAVIDGLICAQIYSKADEEDPRKALNKLLAWEQSVSLDPRVSSAAEALIEQGRQSVLSSIDGTVSVPRASLEHAVEVLNIVNSVPGRSDDDSDTHLKALESALSATETHKEWT